MPPMRAYRGPLLLGILLLLVFVLLAGAAIQPVWSGGGDTEACLALAQGLLRVFWLFTGWFALVTAVHLRFAMSTRLRIAFADLPVAMLASYWLAGTKLARGLFFLGPDPR